MIDVRGNFFYTRTVPCQLWFFDRAKEQDEVRCDQILMLDARNIYRKVSRAIFDFSPEQQRNIAAIVWLYRGQSVRFLKLVESYLGQAVAKGETTAAPLAAFKSALGRLVDLVKPFAAEEHNPDPLTGTWEELISTQATVSTDIDALVAEVAARAADWAKGGNGATLMEPSAFAYAERHDNIEAVFKKLTERRDTADVTELLKELHRIVNEAIRTQAPGDDQAEGLTFDLSQIDVVKLRDEFAKKMHHKATALQDIREIVEQKLAQMLARNPSRMDYQQKYEEIVADYNREKDRVTIEETFRRLTELIVELDAEQRRAVEEGLSEDELALFDLLKKDDLGKAARERVKQASCDLLASIKARLKELDRFWEKEQTKADVKVFILDEVYANLPTPPFTPEEKEAVAAEVYTHVWQQAVRGEFAMAA